MAEAGELCHWEIVQTMAGALADDDVRALADWSVEIQRSHAKIVRNAALTLAEEEARGELTKAWPGSQPADSAACSGSFERVSADLPGSNLRPLPYQRSKGRATVAIRPPGSTVVEPSSAAGRSRVPAARRGPCATGVPSAVGRPCSPTTRRQPSYPAHERSAARCRQGEPVRAERSEPRSGRLDGSPGRGASRYCRGRAEPARRLVASASRWSWPRRARRRGRPLAAARSRRRRRAKRRRP